MITVLIHIMETQDGVLMEEHTSSVLGSSTIAESQVLKELEEKIKDLKMKSDSNLCRFCRCFKSEEPEGSTGKCIYYGLKVSSGFGCRSWTGRF